jgi:hypothetical protein
MAEDNEFWDAFRAKFKDGKVLPILSNSFFINRLFTPIGGTSPTDHYDENIADAWAKNTSYPFRDHYDLAEVAQYDIFLRLSSEKFTDEAKVINEGYLRILKEQLLENLRVTDRDAYDYAAEHSFWPDLKISQFCAEVNLPKYFEAGERDIAESDCVSNLVGNHKVKGYMTTCYFDFLEQAFRLLKRPYYTNHYGNERGFDRINERGENVSTGEFYDSVNSEIPYIYHILGHEKQPESMVMSVDDHINFLIKTKQTQEISKDKKVPIPEVIDSEIRNKTLLFIGYRWQDWEFRTIFRWAVGIKDEDREKYSAKKASVVVQFQPGPRELLTAEFEEAAQKYLQNYFAHCNLDIQWEDSDDFFCKLLQE